jgi:glutamine synthetase
MLNRLKIVVEMSHHEVATGQHEIDFKYSDALTSADNTITFKNVVKGIAVKHGLFATFMPKPIFGQNGNGMHVHQSLFTDEGNAFYDAHNPYHLSEIALHFLAGILHHSRALTAIAAPTVNSYKRLIAGYEAPIYVCWAQHNRSALIRVPRFTQGREQSTRLEARFPDPSANPYLTFATMLEAGLDGIEKRMMPPDPVTDDVYELSPEDLQTHGIQTLPGTLRTALDALDEDEVVQRALGERIYQVYVAAKREEWEAYRTHVSNWELERYLKTT